MIKPRQDSSLFISVLMTAFNREKFIGEAIQSVLASTYTNFELIVIDDCSTDSTVEIVRTFVAKDSRVSLFINDFNLGQFENRNRAYGFARGKWIKYFDSDDVMYDICLETMIVAVQSFPDVGAVAETNDARVTNRRVPVLYTPRESYINHFFKGNNILYNGPSASMIRKDVLEEFSGFNDKIGILADTLLMLQIAAKYPIAGVPADLHLWRRHNQQVTIGQDDWLSMIRQRYQINEMILNAPGFPLSNEDRLLIKRNLKSILVRRIVKTVIRTHNWPGFFKVVSFCDIKPIDFFRAVRKNFHLQ